MAEDQPGAERRGRPRSGFCGGCLVGAVLLLVAIAAVAIGVRRSPDRFLGIIQTIFGAGQAASAPEGGAGLSPEQIKAMRGVKPAVTVTLKEDDLNAYLQQNPGAVGLPKGFEAPQVAFREGAVVASARTKVVVPVRVRVVMRPEVAEGRIRLNVVKVDAGGVSLPGEFRQQVQQEVEALLAERTRQAGFEVQSVEVGEGQLKIMGQLKPKG